MQASVLEWLEHTAENMPERLALWDEKEQLTFREYRKKSIDVAYGISCALPESKSRKPIVVYMDKNVKVLVSFMGIAYSGNFYSPIDIDMPEQRVNKILDVLEPELVITTKELEPAFEKFRYNGNILIYEEILSAESRQAEQVLKCTENIIDTDLLYVLFTSGSTGIPKGVCITHRSVVDYIDWVTDTFKITEEDRFGNQAPFYFDNSILDIYAAMKTGAALYIVPRMLFPQPVRLLEWLREHEISTIFWVPSALMVISRLKAFRKVNLNGILKRVLFCGEVMPNKQLNIWRTCLPDVTYANLYGPTEITDACTCYIVDREFQDEESLPIGVPMKNTEVLVLDEQDCLVTAPGITGELCVRGTCLATGYYGNREKTAAVFVQNPLNRAYEEKIYRTGDLVQYNERFELIYLSRKDYQIKHLGHRIELGEIETAAASLPDVTMCCCLYDEKKNRIVLFLDKITTKEQINSRLAKMLPEYMLPGKVICIEDLPLNANGKIDRKMLRTMMECGDT